MGYDPRGPSVCKLPNGEQRKQIIWPEHKSNDLLKMQDIRTYLIFFHRKVENALIKSY